MRTKKTFINFITDVIPMLLIAVIGIFKIKLFLQYLGVDNQGAYQLYSQIFMYLTLVEAGFGTAIMYKLYAPVKQKDTQKINELLSGNKVIFNVIAIAIFSIGFVLSFGLNFFIKDLALDYTYIQIAFLINLLANVVNYFFIAYNIVFDVNQKKYKTSMIAQSLLIIKSFGEIGLILLGADLIGITTLGFATNLITQIIIRRMAKKQFPALNLHVENKDYSTKTEVRHILPSKVGSLIVNNVDIIVISAFLGLAKVAVYGVYNYITVTIRLMIQKFSAASLSSIGNLTVSDEKDDYLFFEEFNNTMFFIGSVLCIPLYFMLNPFIHVWVGETMMVSNITALFFVLILFTAIIRIPISSFIAVYGLFKQTKKAEYIEAAVNLSATLVGVYYLGILGALMATVGAYLISDIFRTVPLFKAKFTHKIAIYYANYAKYILLIAINSGLIYVTLNFLNIQYDNFFVWFAMGLAVFVVNALVMFGLYKLFVREFQIEKRIRSIFIKKRGN